MPKSLLAIALPSVFALALLSPNAGAQESIAPSSHETSETMRMFREALLRHRPVFRFDSGEDYYPLRVNAITNNTGNRLERSNGELIAQRLGGGGGLNVRYLRVGKYPNGDEVAREDRIVLRHGEEDPDADYLRDARRLYADRRLANRIYGRVLPILDVDTGRTTGAWLQYWVFYYYNPHLQGAGQHEGDWEMIQIHVDADGRPLFANYAQHDTGSECTWGSTERVGRRSQRLVVYVGGGSHASYFKPGDGVTGDRADGEGREIGSVRLRIIGNRSPAWLRWPGFWGATMGPVSSSPRGPAIQDNDRFWNPSEFARSTRETRCR
jgi:hypothetical protein